VTRRFSIAVVAACPFPYPRGTPIRIFRLSDALARRGHDVHVVTYHLGEQPRDTPIHIHRIRNVPTYRKVTPGPTYQKLLLLDVLLARRLARLLRRQPVDLIHAHHFEGLLVALACRGRAGLPVVFDAHTLLESELPFYRMGLFRAAKRHIGRYLDTRLPARASHTIAVTGEIESRLKRHAGLGAEDVSVIPNGVEFEHFAVSAQASANPGGTRTLVFAGNLASYQGIEPMLRSFAELLRERTDVRLCIATDGSFGDYEALAASLRIRDRIDVIPVTFDTLPDVLARADVALNPRISCDGLPQKLLNYLAAGKPVVSFAGSAKGLVHGQLGWVVDDDDVRGFARGIVRLLDDPELARRLGANAREYARTELSWDGTAHRTEQVYRRLLDGRNLGGRS
jgi:glycosyltransferase involved in cell wall biosynthesis